MFDLDRFIADCRDAVTADATHKSVREVVARAVSDPNAVLTELGEPRCAGVEGLYRSQELTILNVVWGPHDDYAAQPPNVGGNRYLPGPRGQHFLAASAGRGRRQDRSRRGQVARRA